MSCRHYYIQKLIVEGHATAVTVNRQKVKQISEIGEPPANQMRHFMKKHHMTSIADMSLSHSTSFITSTLQLINQVMNHSRHMRQCGLHRFNHVKSHQKQRWNFTSSLTCHTDHGALAVSGQRGEATITKAASRRDKSFNRTMHTAEAMKNGQPLTRPTPF
eukprot:3639358-Amphidinium_carterae.1